MLNRIFLITCLLLSSATATAEVRLANQAKQLCEFLLTKMRLRLSANQSPNTNNSQQTPATIQISIPQTPVLPVSKIKPIRLQSKKVQFDDLETLMQAFTQGLLPDFTNQDQINAFDAYLKMYFGMNRQHTPSQDDHKTVANQLKQYPQLLNQPRFRNMEITLVNKKPEPISPELKATTERLLRTARTASSQLFQVQANIGQWRKILQIDKDVAIESIMPTELIAQLANEKVSSIEKCKALAEFLLRHRQTMMAANQKVRPIGQAIADIIHARAFLEKQVELDLISPDTHIRIGAFKTILQIRDSFAMELGFEGHYAEVLLQTQIPSPKGLQNPKEINSYIKKFQNEAYVADVDASNASRVLVRHLSLYEKPHRSCVGGSDCSSRTYFDFALGLVPQYFTLTYPNGQSSGHMTVVLGRFNDEQLPPNAAFLDKVQNVPVEALLPMLEAIRQSLLEQGVELYVPKQLDQHTDGLTNDDFIQVTMQKIVDQIKTPPRYNFKVDMGNYNVRTGYSRAFGRVKNMYAFHLPDNSHEVLVTPKSIDLPWTTSNLNFANLVHEALGLREGSSVEKLKYLSISKLMFDMNLDNPESLRARVLDWITDTTQPLRFRSDVLIYFLQSNLLLELGSDSFKQALNLTKKYSIEDRWHIFNRLSAKGIIFGNTQIAYWSDNKQMLLQYLNTWSFDRLLTHGISGLFRENPDSILPEVFKLATTELSQGLPQSLRDYLLQSMNAPNRPFALVDDTATWIKQSLAEKKSDEVVEAIEEIWARTKKGEIIHQLMQRLLNHSELFNKLMANDELARAYKKYADFLNRPRTGCFVAGTLIETPNGTIPIEQIQVGQRIVAFDPSTHHITTDRVSQLHKIEGLKTVETLEFSDGRTVTATFEHPFYSVDRGEYIQAAQLFMGESVHVFQNGQLNTVQLIDRKLNDKPQKVYNFEAEKFHNYFSNGIHVHNKIEMLL